MIGHFHSHPEEAPRPSTTDRDMVCEADLVWVITSVRGGRVERTTAHRFDAEANSFREIIFLPAGGGEAPTRRQGC